MSDSMIEQSAARLFSENVDKGRLEKFETGAFPAELWQLAVDSGFDLALAGEDAGGIGESYRSEQSPLVPCNRCRNEVRWCRWRWNSAGSTPSRPTCSA